jgi:hypothetical protein
MHVKCIHDLYSLLNHILSSTNSGDFLNDPLSFVFNTSKQIFLFLHVFTFRDLLDVKQTQYFCQVIFLGNWRPWEEEVNKGRKKVEKRAHHVSHNRGHVVGSISGLVHPFNANFVPTDLAWHKTDYIKNPSGNFAIVRRRNTKDFKRIYRLWV